MKTKVFVQNLNDLGSEKIIKHGLNSIKGINLVKINFDENYIEFVQETIDLQFKVLGKLNQLGFPPKIFGNRSQQIIEPICA